MSSFSHFLNRLRQLNWAKLSHCLLRHADFACKYFGRCCQLATTTMLLGLHIVCAWICGTVKLQITRRIKLWSSFSIKPLVTSVSDQKFFQILQGTYFFLFFSFFFIITSTFSSKNFQLASKILWFTVEARCKMRFFFMMQKIWLCLSFWFCLLVSSAEKEMLRYNNNYCKLLYFIVRHER